MKHCVLERTGITCSVLVMALVAGCVAEVRSRTQAFTEAADEDFDIQMGVPVKITIFNEGAEESPGANAPWMIHASPGHDLDPWARLDVTVGVGGQWVNWWIQDPDDILEVSGKSNGAVWIANSDQAPLGPTGWLRVKSDSGTAGTAKIWCQSSPSIPPKKAATVIVP